VDLALREVEGGPVMVILGDTIVKCDLNKYVQHSDYVLGLMPVDDPKRFGIAEIRDNRVVSLVEKPEKPASNLAIIGLYYFADALKLKEALGELIRSGKITRGEIQLTDALEMMIKDGIAFMPFEVDEWLDCGKKETLLDTNRRLLHETGNSPRIEGSLIVPPVYIDPTAQISNSIVGPHVSIAGNTKIENSIVNNSIIGEGTSIVNSVLDNSLIGNSVTVSGSSKSLNISGSSEVDFT
jgi:glucose-1-phosphate thymidylyltransferase